MKVHLRRLGLICTKNTKFQHTKAENLDSSKPFNRLCMYICQLQSIISEYQSVQYRSNKMYHDNEISSYRPPLQLCEQIWQNVTFCYIPLVLLSASSKGNKGIKSESVPCGKKNWELKSFWINISKGIKTGGPLHYVPLYRYSSIYWVKSTWFSHKHRPQSSLSRIMAYRSYSVPTPKSDSFPLRPLFTFQTAIALCAAELPRMKKPPPWKVWNESRQWRHTTYFRVVFP